MDNYIKEFVTVDQLLDGKGVTRRTDAFILTWVKMEKQYRRLFSYFAFQCPSFSDTDTDDFIDIIVKNRKLYFYSFKQLIEKLLNVSIGNKINSELIKQTGNDYNYYDNAIVRIRRYRNKILHGLITGQKLSSKQLETDINILRNWIKVVAKYFEMNYGYDGLGRNTFKKAKSRAPILKSYPFNNLSDLETWINNNV